MVDTEGHLEIILGQLPPTRYHPGVVDEHGKVLAAGKELVGERSHRVQ